MTRLILSVALQPGGTVEVTGEEHHYLSRVRRCRVGDRVILMDKSGSAFDAEVAEVDRARAVLRVTRQTPPASGTAAPVIMGVAVPKRTLMDDVVRKLSEIGVMRLVPLLAERTEGAPSAERVARWRRIADESIRQCGREVPLAVDAPTAVPLFLSDDTLPAEKRLLHPRGEAPLVQRIPKNEPVVLAVGPEGGFTEAELLDARNGGFLPVSLSMPVLRIETAAVAAAVLAVALREI